MTRDMSRVQFLAALARNGFGKPIMFWISSKDDPSRSYGMIFTAKGKLRRRETLAHVLRERNKARSAEETKVAA